MAHYIDKDALVAEIENWKQYTLECGYKGRGDYEDGNKQGRLDTCDKFLSFIDTLKVIEIGVDTGSPEGDIYVKTIWDGDKIVSNKAQKGE